MQLLRPSRLVLLSTLCLTLLLAFVPSVSASNLISTQPLTCFKITGFTPTSGPPGTSVTITGCGFTGATDVAFNGVSTSFTVNSDMQITATVPTGATTGVITVTTPTHTIKSSARFIVTEASPAVTLSTTVGPPTSSVTVSGSNFGSAEAVDVYFDTTDEALTIANGQGSFSVSISVPAGAIPGTHW